jgi:hypothetical protein
MLGEARDRMSSDDDDSDALRVDVAEPARASDAAAERDAPLSPTENLFVRYRKRLTYSYVIGDNGNRELRLDYGLQEILFDEVHLFEFGERLTREAQFTGADATTWGPGYAWDELRPLLEALLAAGILDRGDIAAQPRDGGVVASPLPPSSCPVHRMWSLAECEAITQDLAGHEIEIGHVEAFVPVHRIAHPALDADDRQVGEGNVNPEAMRLDRETEWRVCQYPGTRYRDPLPMNVTALKAMIKYWKPMMATLVEVRAALAARLGISGAWTVGDLHTLACVVLGLPAYQLLQRGGESPQRPVHPVLSSLFRITDGIRMTTYELMTSDRRAQRPDVPMTGDELYLRTEQRGLFIGKTGVCAGPRPMVDEFLAIAVDGAAVGGVAEIELPAEVRDLVSRLPFAIDYALYGLQIWTLTVSSWLAMSRAYLRVADAFEHDLRLANPDDDARLRARLQADREVIENQGITSVEGRRLHEQLYSDAYDHAWRGSRAPIGHPQLAAELAPAAPEPMQQAVADQLRALVTARVVRDERAAAAIARLVGGIVDYLREEQAILRAIAPRSRAIDRLLKRPRPTRPLSVWDLHFNNAMNNGDVFPYFVEMLEEELGIRVECTATTMEIVDRQPGGRAPTRQDDRSPAV